MSDSCCYSRGKIIFRQAQIANKECSTRIPNGDQLTFPFIMYKENILNKKDVGALVPILFIPISHIKVK